MSSSAKTILQIIPALDTGGAERTTVDISNALVARGWKSLVVCEPGRLIEPLEKNGGEWIGMAAASKNPLIILANGFRLAGLIRERGVDLIHARSRAPAWSALLAARLTGVPFVTTCHGKLNQKSWIKGLYNSVMARADAVITNSAFTDHMVRSKHPRAHGRTTIIHRGVDIDQFSMAAVEPSRISALQQAWGVSPDQPVILNLGRLTRWKGQGVLIDAVARLSADKAARLPDNAVVIIAGGDQGRESYRQSLEERIKELGLEGRVRLVGHCDDPEAAIALSSVVVVASIEAETFGRAAAEAQALEKPVIVTDLGAVPETVLSVPAVSSDERTGWRIAPDDPDAIAGALSDVFAMSPAEQHQIGHRGRRHVVENFSLKAMCDKTLAIYDRLLGVDEGIT
ncbi:glycosyltransferase family 4 protein [Coralliovum pocilloporae]|uniref:glycosyltransferase family 4 protein n=1 Tax=Coralliovum pocilloporae TaxID=3066369 RepID=UPI003306D122